MVWLQANWAAVLLIVSEILPLIPGVQSNSLGQLVINGIKQVLASAPAPAPKP